MSDITTLAGRPGRLIVASIKPGSQLTDSIEEVCRIHDVHSAVITSVIGTVEELYLRNPREHTSLPIKQEHEWAHEIDTILLRRKMEILSIQGNVTMLDGKLWAHCHGLFSEAGGNVRGGHVFRATIWSQGEIFLQEVLDVRVERELDPEVTGLPQIKLHVD